MPYVRSQNKVGGTSYADHIAQKYKEGRRLSAHGSAVGFNAAKRGYSGVIRQIGENQDYSIQLSRGRTAQPN